MVECDNLKLIYTVWVHPAFLLLPVLATACTRIGESDARDALNDAFASAHAALAATGATGIALPAGLAEPARARQPPRLGAAVPQEAAAMIGQPAASVRDAFGDPDLVRQDGPAEAWLYSGDSCHLDVMVYRDSAGGEPRVAFAAARATGLARMAESACLHEIAGGPAVRRAGPQFTRAGGGQS